MDAHDGSLKFPRGCFDRLTLTGQQHQLKIGDRGLYFVKYADIF